jgi:hypothetical protein
MTLLALALLFVYMFIRDYHEGGKRRIWYGLMAVFFLCSAIVVAQAF